MYNSSIIKKTSPPVQTLPSISPFHPVSVLLLTKKPSNSITLQD